MPGTYRSERVQIPQSVNDGKDPADELTGAGRQQLESLTMHPLWLLVERRVRNDLAVARRQLDNHAVAGLLDIQTLGRLQGRIFGLETFFDKLLADTRPPGEDVAPQQSQEGQLQFGGI